MLPILRSSLLFSSERNVLAVLLVGRAPGSGETCRGQVVVGTQEAHSSFKTKQNFGNVGGTRRFWAGEERRQTEGRDWRSGSSAVLPGVLLFDTTWSWGASNVQLIKRPSKTARPSRRRHGAVITGRVSTEKRGSRGLRRSGRQSCLRFGRYILALQRSTISSPGEIQTGLTPSRLHTAKAITSDVTI